MNNQESLGITVPLGAKSHRYANKFSSEQSTKGKSKQVYLNTLAVYAVYSYFQWLGIESSLKESDSWDRLQRSQFDVADLWLTGIGRIECCPALPDETSVSISDEGSDARIGYIVVQFDRSLNSAYLLGFSQEIHENRILVNQLQSMDGLLEHLEYVESLNKRTKINDWLDNVFRAGWKEISELVGLENKSSSNTFVAASGTQTPDVRGAKSISITDELEPIHLVISLTEKQYEEEQEFSIQVKILAAIEKSKLLYLPKGLEASIVLSSGLVYSTSKVKRNQNSLELNSLTCESGISFDIVLTFQESTIVEKILLE
ncbi:MAG: DUF1822 family protein [Cyanobacteria bacterium P01_F01_bin.116]